MVKSVLGQAFFHNRRERLVVERPFHGVPVDILVLRVLAKMRANYVLEHSREGHVWIEWEGLS